MGGGWGRGGCSKIDHYYRREKKDNPKTIQAKKTHELDRSFFRPGLNKLEKNAFIRPMALNSPAHYSNWNPAGGCNASLCPSPRLQTALQTNLYAFDLA